MERILVTGGAGFVGSHACKALSRAGFLPVVYDNLDSGSMDFVRWGPFEHGDVCSAERLLDVMLKHKIVAVLHFAALAYVAESFLEPAAYFRTNVLGTWAVLEAMAQAGIRDIVFSSSCAVYGAPSSGLCHEGLATAPINPYGATKAAAEHAIRTQALGFDLNWTSLRYFNAAGADPDGETGERHDPETHIIPLAIKAALCQRVLKVFGGGYETRDGSPERDYVHVSDLADAHVLALNRLRAGGDSQLFNLCAGEGVTVLEICDGVESLLDTPLKRIIAAPRKGDPARLVGDSAAARVHLGWTPQHSALATLIRHAAAWILKEQNSSGAGKRSRPPVSEDRQPAIPAFQ